MEKKGEEKDSVAMFENYGSELIRFLNFFFIMLMLIPHFRDHRANPLTTDHLLPSIEVV